MSGPKKSIIDAAAIRDRRISHAEFRTLAAFGIYANREGRCWPSLRKVGKDLGVSKQAIHHHVRRLINAGYMEITDQQKRDNGGDSVCEYRLLPVQLTLTGGTSDLDAPSTSDLDAPSTSDLDAKKNDPINDPPNDKVIKLIPGQGETPSFDEMFERWWNHVPKKVAKGDARKVFRTALKKTDFQTLLSGIIHYAESEKAKGTASNYIKGPAGWLRGERWLDEPEPNAAASKSGAAAELGDAFKAMDEKILGETR